MRIEYIDLHGNFDAINFVKSFKAALVFTAIDLKIVFENSKETIIKVMAFQVEEE